MGPATKIAYKDGQPGPAAVAFAKKAGVDVSALKVVETPKGEYVAATALKCGQGGGGGDCGGAAEGAGGHLLGEEHVLARGQAGALRAAGALDGGAAGDADVVPVEFGGYTAGAGDVWASRAAWGSERYGLVSRASMSARLRRRM